MSVNLSALQLKNTNLVQRVQDVLRSHGLDGPALELELTERVAMHNPQGAIGVMTNLHAQGVRMSIDDFGTGYSSLFYLKRLPLYELKIDKSFIRDTPADPSDTAIVQAVAQEQAGRGTVFGVGPAELMQTVESLRAQGVAIPVDEPRADVMMVTSVIDYVFRELAISYLGREELDIIEPCLARLRSEGLLARTGRVQVLLYGSLGATGKGHGTERGLEPVVRDDAVLPAADDDPRELERRRGGELGDRVEGRDHEQPAGTEGAGRGHLRHHVRLGDVHASAARHARRCVERRRDL